jgi:hypothetical protein
MRRIILLMMAVVLSGCAKPTEEQRLSKFRGSMKYKAYHFVSEKTTRLTVAEYNKRGAQPVADATIHSTIGLLWFLAEKSEFSFVEADIAGTVATNDVRILSLGLQSIALSKMKYPNLAKSYYDELKSVLATQQGIDTNRLEVEHKVMLLSLIAVSLYHGDPDLAKFGADALGAISQLDYLPPLVGAVVEAKKGSPLKAVAQLRDLNKSERFSEHKKALLTEAADIIANCPDKEKLGNELTNRVLLQLVRRVLDDIFTTENMSTLLEESKELANLITGAKTNQEQASAVGKPGKTGETAIPHVTLSDDLQSKGIVVKSWKYGHGIHGDSTLLVLVDLETKTPAGTALELSAYNGSSNVIRKSMMCLGPPPRTPAYTFLMPDMLDQDYTPREPIAYFRLEMVSNSTQNLPNQASQPIAAGAAQAER